MNYKLSKVKITLFVTPFFLADFPTDEEQVTIHVNKIFVCNNLNKNMSIIMLKGLVFP